jgi:hypothetical protein
MGEALNHQIFWIIRQYLYRPKVLTSNLILVLHLGCTTNQRSIPFEYLLIFWFMVIRVLLCTSPLSWRLVWDKGSGDLMYIHTQGLFEHVPEICLFHWWSFFFYGKMKNFWSLDYSPQVPDSWMSESTTFALFFFFWHWNPTWVLVLCTRSLQTFLSSVGWLQFLSFSFCKSFITSSLHLIFGHTLVLTPTGF